jgi:hypothetical protein
MPLKAGRLAAVRTARSLLARTPQRAGAVMTVPPCAEYLAARSLRERFAVPVQLPSVIFGIPVFAANRLLLGRSVFAGIRTCAICPEGPRAVASLRTGASLTFAE